MELRVLKYFLAIAREQGITRAADVLHITQPTLSRQIAELEEELGVQLFDRSGRRIRLTDEGILFRRRAMEILDLVERTREEVSEQDERIEGTVSIGVAAPALTDIAHYAEIIDRSGFFEATNISADDMKRNEMYRENAARKKMQSTFKDYGEYLTSLQMKGEIRSFIPLYMARIAQLTNNLPRLRRAYAETVPSPLEGTNALAAVRVFRSKDEFMQRDGFLGNLEHLRGEYAFMLNKYALGDSVAVCLAEEGQLVEQSPSHKMWRNKNVFYEHTRKGLARGRWYKCQMILETSGLYACLLSSLVSTMRESSSLLRT